MTEQGHFFLAFCRLGNFDRDEANVGPELIRHGHGIALADEFRSFLTN
jgi:hypothetical protein